MRSSPDCFPEPPIGSRNGRSPQLSCLGRLTKIRPADLLFTHDLSRLAKRPLSPEAPAHPRPSACVGIAAIEFMDRMGAEVLSKPYRPQMRVVR